MNNDAQRTIGAQQKMVSQRGISTEQRATLKPGTSETSATATPQPLVVGKPPAVKPPQEKEIPDISRKTVVYFAKDDDTLSSVAKAILKELARLAQDPNYSVTVVGHASSEGETSYNFSLSQRRAKKVVSFLEGQGLPITPG